MPLQKINERLDLALAVNRLAASGVKAAAHRLRSKLKKKRKTLASR